MPAWNMPTWNPQRSDEGLRSPGTGVTNGWSHSGGLGTEPWSYAIAECALNLWVISESQILAPTWVLFHALSFGIGRKPSPAQTYLFSPLQKSWILLCYNKTSNSTLPLPFHLWFSFHFNIKSCYLVCAGPELCRPRLPQMQNVQSSSSVTQILGLQVCTIMAS